MLLRRGAPQLTSSTSWVDPSEDGTATAAAGEEESTPLLVVISAPSVNRWCGDALHAAQDEGDGECCGYDQFPGAKVKRRPSRAARSKVGT